MEQKLIARIRELQTATPERARFADRLLSVISTIGREYQGAERERMLKLVEETLDRFVEIGDQTARIQKALAEVRRDSARLRQLVDLLTTPASERTLH